jgi:membrane protein implicated in regulation of membrane protease activity
MSWWAWIVVGAVLLGAEMTFIDAQFYLVFVGGAAILTGLGCMALGSPPGALQWMGFALLAAVGMFAFRGRLYRTLKGTTPALRGGPAGSRLTLPQTLAPGESCQVEHGGTFWTARNDAERPILAGTAAHIERVQGLTLLVRPDPRQPHPAAEQA